MKTGFVFCFYFCIISMSILLLNLYKAFPNFCLHQPKYDAINPIDERQSHGCMFILNIESSNDNSSVHKTDKHDQDYWRPDQD